jgi:hypothetical protein
MCVQGDAAATPARRAYSGRSTAQLIASPIAKRLSGDRWLLSARMPLRNKNVYVLP